MRKRTIYLDMDGVIADFNKGVDSILGYHIKDTSGHYPEHEWKQIKNKKNFFRNLSVIPESAELVNVARKFRDQLGWDLIFLTAVPSSNDVPWAFWDKCLWAQQHFPDIPVHFGPYASDKYKHCFPGDILVDDRPSNIKEWKLAGGIAIEVSYNGIKDAIVQLKDLLNYQRASIFSKF